MTNRETTRKTRKERRSLLGQRDSPLLEEGLRVDVVLAESCRLPRKVRAAGVALRMETTHHHRNTGNEQFRKLCIDNTLVNPVQYAENIGNNKRRHVVYLEEQGSARLHVPASDEQRHAERTHASAIVVFSNPSQIN